MDHLEIRWRRPRKAQLVPELNQYTATPAAVVPYPSYVGHFESTRDRTNRKERRLPELNQYPSTPAGYYTGYYPGSGLQKSIRVDYKVTIQALPELNTYPQTTVTADITAWLTHFEPIRNNTNHKLLDLELNQYPTTPSGYYSGYYPGSALQEPIRSSFKQTRQDTPELNQYSQQTSQAVMTAYITHFEKTRNRTNRNLLTLELDQYTATSVWVDASTNTTVWYHVNPEETIWDGGATTWDLTGNVYETVFDVKDTTYSDATTNSTTWSDE